MESPPSMDKAHEIYAALDPELFKRMLDWFRENDRNVYKSAVGSLAQQRKLRPVFIQRKSVADQYAWLLKTLKLRQSDTIGEHLLQAWLMAGNQDLLAAFCDAMKIEHDGKGQVTGELPDVIDAAELDGAVDELLGKFEPSLLTLYLTVFNLQVPGGWEAVSAKLESDERLTLH